MLILKQSTASQSVLLGPFVDDTDGATAETGLTIANTDIRLSKNGGNIVAKNSGGGTHDELGFYTITLDATDTNTVGRLQISCKMTGALVVFMECQVVEEAIYDALFASSAAGFDANGRVDVGSWLGNAVTASSGNPDVNVESIDDIDAPTTWKASINAEADTAISDASLATAAELAKVPKSDGTTSWNATALAAINAEADTAISDASLATAAELAKVPKSDGTTSWNATALAAINAEVDTSMTTYGLDHLLAASVAGTDVTDNSIIAHLVSNSATADWDDYDHTTMSMQGQTAFLSAILSDGPALPTKNVELSNFPFLMVDETDFATPETGLTVTCNISKDGGAFAASTNSAAEIGNGTYKITLTATEMNADTIILRFTATGAADRFVTLITQPT